MQPDVYAAAAAATPALVETPAPAETGRYVSLADLCGYLRTLPPDALVNFEPTAPARYALRSTTLSMNAVAVDGPVWNAAFLCPGSDESWHPAAGLLGELAPWERSHPCAVLLIGYGYSVLSALPDLPDGKMRVPIGPLKMTRRKKDWDKLMDELCADDVVDAVLARLASMGIEDHAAVCSAMQGEIGALPASFLKLYRVGPRWYTLSGLDGRFPKLTRESDWCLLFLECPSPPETPGYPAPRMRHCTLDETRLAEAFVHVRKKTRVQLLLDAR